MKMKKILSIGALALTITTCTSIGTFAATSTSNNTSAFQSVVKNALDCKNEVIFNGVKINAKTPIGDYLTDNFINEANGVLGKYEIKIESSDNYYAVEKKIAKKMKSLDENEKNKALNDIKEFLNNKLNLFSKLNDSDLKAKINYYFETSSYGTLTVGKNSNNDKTVSLEDKNGNILIQVNSSNVSKAQAKLNSVKTYEDLKTTILSYYPEAKSYLNGLN